MESGYQMRRRGKREPPKKNFLRQRKKTELRKFWRREWHKDPLYLKRGVQCLRSRTSISAKRKIPVKKKEKILYVFSQIFSGAANLLTGVFRIALVGGTACLVLAAMQFLLTFAAGAVVSLFNFQSQQKDIRAAAISTIQNCYKEDLNYIAGLPYDQVELLFKDVRDDTYAEWQSKTGAATFYQMSNWAELLSMAVVRFGYDFHGASSREVCDYVRRLYHGSHKILVETYTFSADTGREDKNGDPEYEYQTGAEVTYVSYYFDKLFDCGLSDTRQTITGSSEAANGSWVKDWDTLYAYLRDVGMSHAGASGVMANLAFETGGNNSRDCYSLNPQFIRPNAGAPIRDGAGYGIVQWTYKSRQEPFVDYCDVNGMDYTTLTAQLNYMVYEMSTNPYYRSSWNAATTGTNAGQVALVIAGDGGYEACRADYRAMRVVLADAIAEQYAPYEEEWSVFVPSGDQIAELAESYVGKLHYHWGGWSLTTGADCSGFVSAIYKACGYDYGHQISSDFRSNFDEYRVPVEDIQPGDIIVFTWAHVGIYVGDGYYVAESSAKCGRGKGTAYAGQCPNDCQKNRLNMNSVDKVLRLWR